MMDLLFEEEIHACYMYKEKEEEITVVLGITSK